MKEKIFFFSIAILLHFGSCSVFAQEKSYRIVDADKIEWDFRFLYPVRPLKSKELLDFIKENAGSTKNCFYIKDSFFDEIFLNTLSFTGIWAFDTEGKKRILYPEKSCLRADFLDRISSKIETFELDHTVSLSGFLNQLVPISETEINPHYPTFVIFWNRTLGMMRDRNIFNWEQNLRVKFDGNVNILRVSTDAMVDWEDSVRKKQVGRLERVVDAMR